MNCAELDILLCDFLDGAVEAEQRKQVEAHLAGCPACAELARDASGAVAFLKRVAEVDPPAELITRILFQTPAKPAPERRGGLRAMLGRWFEPVLQPRFAMGMAMTILSFAMLGRFSGIQIRQLEPADFHPAKLWASLDDKVHRSWERAVKYYENLRFVYEIQGRLQEWRDHSEPAASQPEGPATQAPDAEKGKASQ